MRARLSLTLIVGLVGGPLLAQSAPPSANRQWLSGAWKLDKSGPPEDEKNWNRAPKLSPATAPDGSGRPAVMPPRIPDSNKVYSIMWFGLKLISASETLAVDVQQDGIMLRDDFREPTRFETTGRAMTMNVLMSYARGSPDNWFVPPPRSFTASVKSSWKDDALVQELWTRDLSEIVRITRTLIPFDEGRKMLFVIKVLEPKLKEPVKDIERGYVRASETR